MTAPTAKLTEADLLGMLRDRYCRPGNGGSGEYALLTHVRDDAGFGAKTTTDAIALGLWSSRGHLLHAFEVKCSRPDWLREMRNPAKAQRIAARVDRFWLVTASPDIVQAGELPDLWGHLTVRGGRLAVAKDAPGLGPDQAPIDRAWLVCLLRAAGAIGTGRESDSELGRARAEGHAAGLASATAALDEARRESEALRGQLADADRARVTFLRDAGLPVGAGWYAGEHLARLAPAVRVALEGGDAVQDAENSLRRARDQLLYGLRAVESALGERIAVDDADPPTGQEDRS